LANEKIEMIHMSIVERIAKGYKPVRRGRSPYKLPAWDVARLTYHLGYEIAELKKYREKIPGIEDPTEEIQKLITFIIGFVPDDILWELRVLGDFYKEGRLPLPEERIRDLFLDIEGYIFKKIEEG